MKELRIKWQTEDVLSCNKALTIKEANAVLKMLETHHNAEIGVNWDVIHDTISNLYPTLKNGLVRTISHLFRKPLLWILGTDIELIWYPMDVLSVHPHLSTAEAERILDILDEKHDATIGINWDVIEATVELHY